MLSRLIGRDGLLRRSSFWLAAAVYGFGAFVCKNNLPPKESWRMQVAGAPKFVNPFAKSLTAFAVDETAAEGILLDSRSGRTLTTFPQWGLRDFYWTTPKGNLVVIRPALAQLQYVDAVTGARIAETALSVVENNQMCVMPLENERVLISDDRGVDLWHPENNERRRLFDRTNANFCMLSPDSRWLFASYFVPKPVETQAAATTTKGSAPAGPAPKLSRTTVAQDTVGVLVDLSKGKVAKELPIVGMMGLFSPAARYFSVTVAPSAQTQSVQRGVVYVYRLPTLELAGRIDDATLDYSHNIPEDQILVSTPRGRETWRVDPPKRLVAAEDPYRPRIPISQDAYTTSQMMRYGKFEILKQEYNEFDRASMHTPLRNLTGLRDRLRNTWLGRLRRASIDVYSAADDRIEHAEFVYLDPVRDPPNMVSTSVTGDYDHDTRMLLLAPARGRVLVAYRLPFQNDWLRIVLYPIVPALLAAGFWLAAGMLLRVIFRRRGSPAR